MHYWNLPLQGLLPFPARMDEQDAIDLEQVAKVGRVWAVGGVDSQCGMCHDNLWTSCRGAARSR
jgi:hypothetical protein